jgi:HTH-type transcriptional regulator, transcriptional repressor of NAD biosynthesis genes
MVAMETPGTAIIRGPRVISSVLPAPRNATGLGLVVGKFAPLHLGHEWLIEQAAQECERLLILSYANPELERCPPETRRRWLAVRFPDHQSIVIDGFWLDRACNVRHIASRALPTNDSSDEDQQRFLAWLLSTVLEVTPDTFFCSEAYGPRCAEVLTTLLHHPVKSVILDQHRSHLPISATQIRENPHDRRDWMSADVRAAFVHRIAVLGGESSGKTTLTAALAADYKTVWVAEYGRQLWDEQSGVLTQQDLLKIAHEQIRREEAALREASQYLFCDTSPLTTAGYSGWMFDSVDEELAELATRSYDAVVLCRPDFPFVQDGTRRDETFRLQQHAWYQQRLVDLHTPVLEVTSTVSDRVKQVAGWLRVL